MTSTLTHLAITPSTRKVEDHIDSESSPSNMMNAGSNSGSSRLAEDRLDCFLELGVGVLLRHSCKGDRLFLCTDLLVPNDKSYDKKGHLQK